MPAWDQRDALATRTGHLHPRKVQREIMLRKKQTNVRPRTGDDVHTLLRPLGHPWAGHGPQVDIELQEAGGFLQLLSQQLHDCMLRLMGRTDYHLPRDFAIPIHRKVLLEAVEGFRAAFAAVADVFILDRDAPVRGDVLLDAPPPGSPSGSGSVSCVIIWAMVSMTSFIGGAWVARVWCCASQPCHQPTSSRTKPRARSHALVDLPEEVRELILGEVALFGVDRFALAAVHGDECPRAEVRLLAQQRALTTDWPHGLQIVLPEVRHRLVLRPKLLQQPHQLHIAVGRLCQATTRPETGEITVHVQLQQISRVVGRSSRGSGCGSLKAACREVEGVSKGVEETDGILCGNGVVEPLWELDLFVAVRAVDKAHAGTKLQESKAVSRCG